MYRPNFCCDCGRKILRLHWQPWTSNRFCDDCARRLRKERIKRMAFLSIVLLSVGFMVGRVVSHEPPPLIIQRAAIQPQNRPDSNGESVIDSKASTDGDIYICGARTKKGTPCSRRVHGNVRCWQHKGMQSMLPPEKLIVKG
jgi:hypothetical protein